MIDCPNCKITFTPRFRVCPQCQAFEANLEDRVEYLADSAEAALGHGSTPADVESILLEEGMPSLVASEIVSARARKVKREARSYGLFRVLGGSGLLLAAIMLVIAGFISFPSRWSWLLLGA